MDTALCSHPTFGLETSHFIKAEEHGSCQTKGPRYFSFLIFRSAYNKLWQFAQITDISPKQNPSSLFWDVVLDVPEALKGVIEVYKEWN